MNRWLKYGGIMPETINISGLTYERGKIIRSSGAIENSSSYYITNRISVNPDTKYVLKFLNTEAFNYTGSAARINFYNGNRTRTITLTVPQRIVNEDVMISERFSTRNETEIIISARNAWIILEIEKL